MRCLRLWMPLATMALGLMISCASALAAASAGSAQIIVAGHGEVTIPPTHGRFTIAITSSAATASTAGSDNARLSKAVSDALFAAGMTREELLGTRLNVNAKWDYDDHGRRKGRTMYEATNTLRVESARLEQLGVLVDAALGAGASSVSDVDFSARNATTARRQALTLAMEDARSEADTIARAAGGLLGELVAVTTERSGVPAGELQEMVVTANRRAMAAPVPTSVTPNDIVIAAHVNARWGFLPARH
ncbi:MAG: SIMPL domain-containing protein [Pseudomonadota bacterium]